MRANDGVRWGGGLIVGGLLATGACNVTPGTATTFDTPPTTSIGSQGPEDSGGAMSTSTGVADETTAFPKLDTPMPNPGGEGCQYVDFLFVIDNSASMATFQLALTENFPQFVDKMYEALPPAIDVHVGMTTTDFDTGCDAQEATMNCQTTATLAEVESHYIRPDVMNDGGNGAQGRLFSFAGQTYYETTSDEDPAGLTDWFSQAAVAAGEEGCSFEMPVAAAGFATHLANAVTNDGFVRDEGGLLVVFFLTDEPDKSVEAEGIYADMILEAKAECGGKDCVFVGGLVPECVMGNQAQKLWRFINLFDTVPPVVGDIELTQEYATVFGDGLAAAIAEACANVPAVG